MDKSYFVEEVLKANGFVKMPIYYDYSISYRVKNNESNDSWYINLCNYINNMDPSPFQKGMKLPITENDCVDIYFKLPSQNTNYNIMISIPRLLDWHITFDEFISIFKVEIRNMKLEIIFT